MSAHTPGPWGWVFDKRGQCQSLAGPTGAAVVDFWSDDEMCTEGMGVSDADAALIARAPDLLTENAALRAELALVRGAQVLEINEATRLRAELERTKGERDACEDASEIWKARLTKAEADRDALRLRVEALTEALKGVLREMDAGDPNTVGELELRGAARKKARAALEVKP